MGSEAFASNLRRLRTERGLTATRLAKQMNMSLNAISQYERGITEPSILTLKRLADLLHVSTDELLEGVTSEPSIDMAEIETPWIDSGFKVRYLGETDVLVEPTPEVAAEQECLALSLTKDIFTRLTRKMVEESRARYPDDRALADYQFSIWARIMTSKQAALRRLDPFSVIGSFVPVDCLPPSFRPPTQETKKEPKEASAV